MVRGACLASVSKTCVPRLARLPGADSHLVRASRCYANDAKHADAQPASSAPKDNDEELTGADKLLRDALLQEAEEEAIVARRQRVPDPNDPVWTGEERIQDTVLRMVMDKYKPLRIKLADDGTHPADAKIQAGIQTPSSTASAIVAEEAVSLSGPKGEGEHEDGRRLPKTPDARPWRAVYVRPSHLLGSGAEDTPSVYYGQYLQSSSSSSSSSRISTGGPGSDLRHKLKKAGVNASALPLDNPKAMNQLRQGIKAAERRGKLLKARDLVLDYTLAKPQQDHDPNKDPSADPNLQLQLGQARGWASVVEERIKAAQEAGLFKENKLRGKPITRDIEERNPFLGREEFFMNRIVKRQGAAPPWVELNMALESELASWKERMTDAWVRRASRMITTSPLLRPGMEPLSPEALAASAVAASTELIDTESPHVPASQTAGQQKLIEVATRYRDMEWEDRERAYHQFELKRLNDLIRNHNHLAPFTARKGLLMLDLELKAMFARSLPLLIARLSELLEQERNPRAPLLGAEFETNAYGMAPVTYDIWGREIKATDPVRAGGWLGRASTDGDKDGSTPNSDYGPDLHRHQRSHPQGSSLLVALRRSVEWARERIGV